LSRLAAAAYSGRRRGQLSFDRLASDLRDRLFAAARFQPQTRIDAIAKHDRRPLHTWSLTHHHV
jgi:hypothetical protein